MQPSTEDLHGPWQKGVLNPEDRCLVRKVDTDIRGVHDTLGHHQKACRLGQLRFIDVQETQPIDGQTNDEAGDVMYDQDH